MNNLLIITLVNQLLFLTSSYFAPKVLAEKDAIQIDANGRLDTLKDDWHELNVAIRFYMFFPLGLAAIFPAFFSVKSVAGIAFSVLLLFSSYALNAAIHWIRFDRNLNEFRGLEPGYVGSNSNSDRYLQHNPTAKKKALIASILFYLVSLVLLLRCV